MAMGSMPAKVVTDAPKMEVMAKRASESKDGNGCDDEKEISCHFWTELFQKGRVLNFLGAGIVS
jgi:hypothetical protein